MVNEKTKIADTVSKGMGKNIGGELPLYGHFSVDHIRDGQVIDHREVDNVVTNVGKAEVAGLILTDIGGTAFDYIAIGTGVVAATATNTVLGGEITTQGGERAAGTGTVVSGSTAQLQVTYTFTDVFAVTETGMFNHASTGTLLSRQTFAAVNVASGDLLTITWKIQVQ